MEDFLPFHKESKGSGRVSKPWIKSDKKTGSAGLTRENFHYKLSSVSTTETSDFTLFLFSVRFSLTLSFGPEQTWVIDIRAGSFNQQGSFPVSPVLFTGSSQTLSGGKPTLLPLLSASLTDRSGVRERAVDDPDGREGLSTNSKWWNKTVRARLSWCGVVNLKKKVQQSRREELSFQ